MHTWAVPMPMGKIVVERVERTRASYQLPLGHLLVQQLIFTGHVAEKVSQE